MKYSRLFLPNWWQQYQPNKLKSDVVAGLLVTILVLPQSLAYAVLAGLPPQAGLLTSTLPVLAYALVGSSMTQAVGPVAITSLMTLSVLGPLATPGSAHYLLMASTLAFFSGVLVFVFGLLRLGFLSNLLSKPVINGFISGSAILILLSQLNPLLGMRVHSSNSWGLFVSTLEQLPNIHANTALIGFSGLIFLLFLRIFLMGSLKLHGISVARGAIANRLAPLLVLVIATVSVISFDLDKSSGVAVVGTLEFFSTDLLPHVPKVDGIGGLMAPALLMAFIGSIQNITMAQALAAKRRERINANRELIGLGLSNVVASFVGGMPVGGGLSRSAVNLASGAQTPLASVVSALFMMLIVLMNSNWFSRIPLTILAATIMVAAISMIDLSGLMRAWRYDRADGFAFLGTTLGVLILGLQNGIVLGILLSIVILIYRASIPHIAVVGRILGTEHFRNEARHAVETLPGVIFLRIDESLFFGNFSIIESRIASEINKRRDIHDVVLIMSAVNQVDLTAIEALTDLIQSLDSVGVKFHMAEIKGPVQDRILQTELWQNLSGRIHLSVNEAFEALKSQIRPIGFQSALSHF